MKTTKNLLALLMAALMCFAVFGGVFAESIPNMKQIFAGVCGDAIAWELDSETGLFTITGVGPMYDYELINTVNIGYHPNMPWYNYLDSIVTVCVGEGVSYIGAEAFYGCENLISVSLPSSLNAIGQGAFSGCHSLTALSLPDGLSSIGMSAFNGCWELHSIVFPPSVTMIEDGAFYSTNLYYALFLGIPPEPISNSVFVCTSGFRIYYMSEYVDEWAPNGEGAWSGYPIFPAYTVTFFDSIDGSVIDEQIVFTGKSAEAPEPPSHYGYSFIGWDSSFDSVTENLTVTALYESATTIEFTGEVVEVTKPKVGDTFYWRLGVSEGSGLGSGRWLVDYDEQYFKATAFSATWSGGIIAQINASWDDDEPWSDKPEFAANINYEGQTGSYPVGEAGNLYCNVGMYLNTYEFMGLQAGGDMFRITMKWTAIPEHSMTIPVSVTAAEAKRVIDRDGDLYAYADYDFVNVQDGAVIVNITEPEPPAPLLPGDVNGDGEVTFADVAALYNYILGGSIDPRYEQNCDYNGDGEVTFEDISSMYSRLLGN